MPWQRQAFNFHDNSSSRTIRKKIQCFSKIRIATALTSLDMPDSPPLLMAAGSSTPSGKCQICRLQAAKYTCPTCNLRYCSLNCFRSEGHANCSENFYKESLINEVAGRQDVDNAEKAKVLEMLKRLEEGQGSDNDELENEEDENEEAGFASALEGLDIDDLSPEELLSHLSPAQRKAFEEILGDPKKAEALLDSSEYEQKTPWWQQDDLDAQDAVKRPAPIPREKLIPVKSQDELNLGYNLVSLLIAYALHHQLGVIDEKVETQQSALAALLPWLTTKSTEVLESVAHAVDYVLGSLQQDLIIDRQGFLLLLLDDLQKLLWLPKVTLEDTTSSDKTYLALSDLYNLYSKKSAAGVRLYPLAAPKLLFYASNLSRLPRRRLLDELAAYRAKLDSESKHDERLKAASIEPLNIGALPSRKLEASQGAKIVEIE